MARANSQAVGHLCPDPEVCSQCPDSDTCIYLQNQLNQLALNEFLRILERRVQIGNTCLVKVGSVTRKLASTLDTTPKRLSTLVNNTLAKIGATPWAEACSEMNPHASMIYQVDEVTLESLRWHVDWISHGQGGECLDGHESS